MGTRTAGQKRISKRIHVFKDNYIEYEHEGEAVYFERSLGGGVELYSLRINSPNGDDVFAVRADSNFDNRANRSFFARLYKPPVATADHVVLIYNGLDETIFTQEPGDLFKFYDDLGLQLAEANILAILLPTPYHMNRALAYVDAEVEEATRAGNSNFIDFTIPTEALMERNWNIYRNHFQGFRESVEVCRRLRPDLGRKAWSNLEPCPEALPAKATKFLQGAVSSSVKISLLGYSLGGLRALTEYVFDWHDAKAQKREPLFTACVAVNSGGALSVLPNPPWVDSRRWRSMIEDLLRQNFAEDQHGRTLKALPKSQHKTAERYYSFLNDVFLGQAASLNSLGAATREAANGMLFVVGGSDNLVPLESIKRFAPAGGVTIFQVAGMGHLFPYDPAWRLWKGVVLDVITKFLDNKARIRTAESDFDSLARLISLMDHALELIPYHADLERPDILRRFKERVAAIENAGARVMGGAWRRVGVADLDDSEMSEYFQGYAESLVERLHLEVRRGVVHPGLYKRRRKELLLGRFLIGSPSPLQDAWEELAREPGERIGEALVRMGVVREEDRDDAVAEQRKALDVIRELMAQEFSTYVLSERRELVRV